jgi:uncharacterized protein YbjT (DUF2867 family)
VTGATGRQGGAVLRQLLELGRPVRALTRDATSPKARALATRGAEIVEGDLGDRESLARAVAGTRAVFSVQDPWLHGVAAEIRQGKMLADVAKQAGVRRFVQASVAAADLPTGLPHFESKGAIERHVESLGFEAFAVRPVLFMESLVQRHEKRAPYILGMLRRGLRGKSVQLVTVNDIGRIAAEALLAEHDGTSGLRVLEVAGDELTFDQIVAVFVSLTSGRPRVVDLPLFVVRLLASKPYSSYRWMGEHGWRIDLVAHRAERPWLTTFDAWLRADSRAMSA